MVNGKKIAESGEIVPNSCTKPFRKNIRENAHHF